MRKKDLYSFERKAAKLEKNAKKIEKKWGGVENFVITTTFDHTKHTMRMEEDSFSDDNLLKVYEDLEEFEIADLSDYQSLSEEYGKFCKKRRHIFCRPQSCGWE